MVPMLPASVPIATGMPASRPEVRWPDRPAKFPRVRRTSVGADAAPGLPDATKEFKVDTGYAIVKLIQKTAPAVLTEPGNVQLSGINLVTLTAQWMQSGITQSKQIRFYVYRPR